MVGLTFEVLSMYRFGNNQFLANSFVCLFVCKIYDPYYGRRIRDEAFATLLPHTIQTLFRRTA